MKNVRIIIFSLLLCILLFIFYFCFCKTDEIDLNVIIDNHELNMNLIYSVSIDGSLCPYDRENDIYYYSTDRSSLKFQFGSYYDVDYEIYSFEDNIYKILVYDNYYYELVSVVIDSIPIVNIYDMSILDSHINLGFDYNFFSSDDSFNDSSTFVGVQIINYNQTKKNNSFISFGDLSIRGTSSSFFEKKSYKLKLEKKFGFDGVKKDNVWVLDALYTDQSKIRNKLSSDLWNEINDNQVVNNDLFGDYVELFVNNEYKGLYVLKEKVDSSVVGSGSDSILLKASSHLLDERILSFLENPYDFTNEEFLNFEIKKYNKKTFNKFFSNMFLYYSSDRSYNVISSIYDLDNFLNYKIFVSLICGEDNITSNQYYYVNDEYSKIIVTPWDMDLTWGLYWNLDRELHSEFSWNNFTYEWMDANITKMLDSKTLLLLKNRYWELRKNVITMDNINKYLDSYESLLIDSGAAVRDSDKWYYYDIHFEIEQIRQWASLRIYFLDDYFRI